MKSADKYTLVHITTSGEYKAPLVASQLFDQAEFQATIKEGFSPAKVQAWIIGPMREYADKKARETIDRLKKRCPNIGIHMINGLGRLKNFPVLLHLKFMRLQLGRNTRVVYHCRGENAAEWALLLRKAFPQDRVVLDVRGYWPAELLYSRGIDDPQKATGKDAEDYKRAKETLRHLVATVDAVTTVSTALKELLISEVSGSAQTSVVPCCVSDITNDEQRAMIRSSWGIKEDEIAVVYSGSTAAYQHLDDLTIPFLKQIVEKNDRVRLVFLSSEIEKIKGMLTESGVNTDNVILKSYPQKEVAAALTACDAGILMRKPTLVNRVANPVKIAEYLAAGLPVIIEKGVGGVPDNLLDSAMFKGVQVAERTGNMREAAHDVSEWLLKDTLAKRDTARAYVKEVYLWRSAIHVSRKMYQNVLSEN